ncbi:MAG: AAA family ATPase [Acidobacteria bacterium]|nr:AAA family ATPase [Acidobacteriota bacterium]
MGAVESPTGEELIRLLSSKVVGQEAAFRHIVPYLEMHRSGLAPEERPIGVFLLLGPTGTGKTRTVEALAEALHGSAKRYLRINCGEYQMDHEVARLIGAPPGYVGHKETKPVLTQSALQAVTTPDCDVSLVLFDEVEKSAPSLTTLLLGVLDKAVLQTGDNASVNFERCLVFLTSNLGAREMMKEMSPSFGFHAGQQSDESELAAKLEGIAMGAVRKRFSPEFVNRIDAVLTYQPLSPESLTQILDLQIDELRQHVKTKLGARSFGIDVTQPAREFLVRLGTAPEYGARELRRTVYRQLTQPLATLVAQNRIEPGSLVTVDCRDGGEALEMKFSPGAPVKEVPGKPQVLIVDDNTDLLRFLATVMSGSGWDITMAESALEARQKTHGRLVDVALLDYMLPDQNGVELGLSLRERQPELNILIMTGAQVPPNDEEVCRVNEFAVIQKPFLIEDVLEPVRRRLQNRSADASKR